MAISEVALMILSISYETMMEDSEIVCKEV